MEEQKDAKKKSRRIVFILSLLLLLGGLIYLVIYFVNADKNHDVYDDMQKDNEKIEQQIAESDVEMEEDSEKKPVKIPINFKKLKKRNPDIYAWIRIKDTNIDYPIVQSATDDSYYLDHTIDGVAGYPGSIYTESVNAKDFTDFNTLIYGHDMKDGSMFKHLHKFEDASFFESHDKVTIYTETEIKKYRIYAALLFDDRHIVYSFNQETTEGRKAFLQALSNSSSWSDHFREGMTIDENSRLITLSTCVAGRPDKRYIVVAEEIVES